MILKAKFRFNRPIDKTKEFIHRRTELDAAGFIRAEENDKRTPD